MTLNHITDVVVCSLVLYTIIAVYVDYCPSSLAGLLL